VHARRPVQLRAIVTHVAAGWQQSAIIVNLSLGGACALLDEHVAVDDVITLSFIAPTLWDPLVLRARLAWVGPSAGPGLKRAGVTFDQKSASAMLTLFELIATSGYE
jgi:hypothetical protein